MEFNNFMDQIQETKRGIVKHKSIKSIKYGNFVYKGYMEYNDKLFWTEDTSDGIFINLGVASDSRVCRINLNSHLFMGNIPKGENIPSIVLGLARQYAPWELEINIIDLRVSDLNIYCGIPNIKLLGTLDSELDMIYTDVINRQKRLIESRCVGIEEYNSNGGNLLRNVVIIFGAEERHNEFIDTILRLGRNVGYHLIVCNEHKHSEFKRPFNSTINFIDDNKLVFNNQKGSVEYIEVKATESDIQESIEMAKHGLEFLENKLGSVLLKDFVTTSNSKIINSINRLVKTEIPGKDIHASLVKEYPSGNYFLNPTTDKFEDIYNHIMNIADLKRLSMKLNIEPPVLEPIGLVIDYANVISYNLNQLNRLKCVIHEANLFIVITEAPVNSILNTLPVLDVNAELETLSKSSTSFNDLINYLPKGNVHLIESNYQLKMITRYIKGITGAINVASEYAFGVPKLKDLFVVIHKDDLDSLEGEHLEILFTWGELAQVKTIVLY